MAITVYHDLVLVAGDVEKDKNGLVRNLASMFLIHP